MTQARLALPKAVGRILNQAASPRLLVQGAAVVLSILLAFAIDAWWDAHQEHKRQQSLLVELREEFESNRPGLESRVTLARRMAEGTARFLELLDTPSAAQVVAVPHTEVFAVLGGPTYEPVMNTLDAAIASGEIAMVADDRLRAELATWRRLLKDANEDENEVRRITNEQIVPLLSRSLNLAPYFEGLLAWSGGDQYFSGRLVGGGPGQVAQDGVAVAASTELAGALALRKFYVEFAAADLQDLLESLDRTITLIDGQIEP